MALSWSGFWSSCKSRLSAISFSLYHGRQRLRKRIKNLRTCLKDRKKRQKELKSQLEQTRRENENLRQKISELEREREQQSNQPSPMTLPEDPPLPHHQFGPRMISLCVNLARCVGLRPSRTVLDIFFRWLGVSVALPTWESIRMWLLRVGVARMTQPLSRAKDYVWMADHSNQIGPEKALVVLAIRASKLPRKGKTIKRRHMRILTVLPGTQWKTANMTKVYEDLIKRYGEPRAILADGAVELRDSVKALKTEGIGPLVLRDFKHFLANQFESVVGGEEKFREFISLITQVRSSTQQTELSHFAPPGLKAKARFMNLRPLLAWATMVLWHLDHPGTETRKEILPERMESRLGGLREFAESVRGWWSCQEVISEGLKFINESGLEKRTAEEFRRRVEGLARSESSREIMTRAEEFLKTQAAELKAGERLPLSTEILESMFGSYKHLEKQHSKGGFTQLLPAMGALLLATTESSIRRDFKRVKVKDVQEWIKTHMPRTLASQRKKAYGEFRKAKRDGRTASATESNIGI